MVHHRTPWDIPVSRWDIPIYEARGQETETAKVARHPPPAYWLRRSTRTARGPYPAACSRITAVRECLSPSLTPHMGDSVSAAATKLCEPAANYSFFEGFLQT